MMWIKYLIFIFVFVLLLTACGRKGPVKPVDTPSSSTEQTDTDTDKKSGSCGN